MNNGKITEKVTTPGMAFTVRDLVCINGQYGKACGAKQANCNVYTVPMLLQPVDDRESTLNDLKAALQKELDKVEL